MELKKIIAQLVALYSRLTRNQKIVVASSIAIVIGFIVFLVVYNAKREEDVGYKVLFDRLSGKDSSLIVEQLEQDKIPYKIGPNGTIEVPEEIVYKQRIKIAGMGLPKDSRVGFELFDKQEFGATDFDQQVKYLRALEGELSRTIESLSPIEKAKVHIALPKDSLFVSKQTPPTASVSLELKDQMRLNRRQVLGIKNLVSSSVAKLLTENVTVIDSDGEPLGDDDEYIASSEEAKVQLRYKARYEKAYEAKIVEVLAPFIGGAHRVVAKVTIDFDFSKKEQTKETFDPENVVRSEETLEEKREGHKPKEIGGVPGAVSNIGPVEGIDNQNLGEKYSKNQVATNYEISKTVSSVKGEFATIKRVTAAVVVDGKYENKRDEDGSILDEMQYISLDQTQLNAIESLVNQAIGVNAERGDEVSVTNFQFEQGRQEMQPLSAYEKLEQELEKYMGPAGPILKYLLVAIILFLLYKKVIVPFSERMLEVTAEDEDGEKPMLNLEDEEDEDLIEKVQAMRKKVEDQLGIAEGFDEDELKYEVLLEKVRAVTEDKPEEIAVLFESLISEETGLVDPNAQQKENS